MSKYYRILILMSAFLVVQNAFSQIVINEYSCANSTSAGDPDFFGEMEEV